MDSRTPLKLVEGLLRLERPQGLNQRRSLRAPAIGR